MSAKQSYTRSIRMKYIELRPFSTQREESMFYINKYILNNEVNVLSKNYNVEYVLV